MQFKLFSIPAMGDVEVEEELNCFSDPRRSGSPATLPSSTPVPNPRDDVTWFGAFAPNPTDHLHPQSFCDQTFCTGYMPIIMVCRLQKSPTSSSPPLASR